MQVIEALIAGVRGAENGQAYVYRRGTTSAATWYADYDGSAANSTGNAITLDANGGAEIYVNEPVRVVAKSPANVTIREWDVMTPSSAVELVSTAFTGNDYVTGAAAVNKPAWLDVVMNKWLTKHGAPDWDVKVGSVTNDIPFFLSKFIGMVFYVKDEEYGGVGDGVTDDTAAITAAVAAANTAGGGAVVFSAGTYRTTSVINVPVGVSLIGVGAGAVTITIDHASADALSFTGASGLRRQWLLGLSVVASQPNAGNMVVLGTAGVSLVIAGCTIGDGGNAQSHLIEGTVGTVDLSVRDTQFTVVGSSAIRKTGGDGLLLASGISVVASGTYASNMLRWDGSSHIEGSTFDASGVTSGTYVCLSLSGSTVDERNRVTGCTFLGGSSTGYAIEQGGTGLAHLSEANNLFDSITAYSVTSADSDRVVLGSREHRYLTVQDDSAAITLPSDQFGTILLERTVTGVVALTAAACVPLGAMFRLIVHNNGSGGNVTVGMTSGWAVDTSPAVSNNTVTTFLFVARDTLTGGSAPYWQKVSSHLSTAEY